MSTEPDQNGESYVFQHARFRPGLHVYIDPAIREIHPLSPVAGLIGTTCTGIAYKILEPFEDQKAQVPVQFQFPEGLRTFYVEEQYVLID